MYQWSESQQFMRDTFRKFVEEEIAPHLDDIEYNGVPPYDILRKMFTTFGMDTLAAERVEKQLALMRAEELGQTTEATEKKPIDPQAAQDAASMQVIPTIELCRYSPGLVTALGVSVGLTGAAIMTKGTAQQIERWAEDVLSLRKVGAWAITEPGSGSDAFGSMRSVARRDGEGGYIINGSKTFITNGPYADTIVFICKLDEPGVEPAARKVLTFVLDSGMEGLEQGKPFKKMGIGSSPTGELFLSDVRAGIDRLLGGSEDAGGRSGAKSTFHQERTGVASMALGIVERCLEMCLAQAREREQFGQPIGQFQLVQLKLAKMEVARVNLQGMVFRAIEMRAADAPMSLAEASAMKLYAAQTAMEVTTEAVQIFGGSGYIRETRVEQFMRDAKILQIYAGTDEIQVSQIARDLLDR